MRCTHAQPGTAEAVHDPGTSLQHAVERKRPLCGDVSMEYFESGAHVSFRNAQTHQL